MMAILFSTPAYAQLSSGCTALNGATGNGTIAAGAPNDETIITDTFDPGEQIRVTVTNNSGSAANPSSSTAPGVLLDLIFPAAVALFNDGGTIGALPSGNTITLTVTVPDPFTTGSVDLFNYYDQPLNYDFECGTNLASGSLSTSEQLQSVTSQIISQSAASSVAANGGFIQGAIVNRFVGNALMPGNNRGFAQIFAHNFTENTYNYFKNKVTGQFTDVRNRKELLQEIDRQWWLSDYERSQLLATATSADIDNAVEGLDERQLVLGALEGANAALGSLDTPFAIWLNGGISFIDVDPIGFKSEGDVYNISAGVDKMLSDNLILGLSVGYEESDFDINDNDQLESDGYTVAPYVGLEITEGVLLSLQAGYASLNYDVETGGATGDFDSDRFFGSADVAGVFTNGPWRLSPGMNILYLEEEQEDYTLSSGVDVNGDDITLGRASLGGEIGYLIEGAGQTRVEPYVLARAEWDFDEQDNVELGGGQEYRPDDFGGVIGGGLNVVSTNFLQGNLQATYNSIGRDDTDNYSIRATLRANF